MRLRRAQREERPERERDPGREAPRVGDEPRAPHPVAVDLGQPVHRPAHGVGGGGGQAVDGPVRVGVAQPVVGAEVDDEPLEPGRPEAPDRLGALPVLGAHERGVEVGHVEALRRRVQKVRLAAEARVRRPHRPARLAPAGDGSDLDGGVAEEERDQLAAGVAGAVEDGNADGRHGRVEG